MDAQSYFDSQAHFNKCLKQLTEDEQRMIIDMLNEFSQQKLQQCNVMRSLPSAEEIDAAIKDLGKQSTAPDKETPDWLEVDIRRGMLWMLNRVVGNAV